MKFIKKKNLQEGEELLYIPRLHWMFTIKHILQSLPFFLILLCLGIAADSIAAFLGLAMDPTIPLIIRGAVKYVFLFSLVLVVLDFVWRIFQYLCTEYGVTNRRLIIKKGVIRLAVAEIPTDRIESIYCFQTLFGRIFHYGTVYISGIGGKQPMFYMVSKPYALRRKITKIMEKNKAITVVHGELPGRKVPVVKEPEEEPIYRYGSFVRVMPDR